MVGNSGSIYNTTNQVKVTWARLVLTPTLQEPAIQKVKVTYLFSMNSHILCPYQLPLPYVLSW